MPPPNLPPITTQEKMDYHAAKKAKEQKPKLMSPPRGVPEKKRKPKYLAPPGEAFQTAKGKGLGSGGVAKGVGGRKKAITTAEKQKEHEMKRKKEVAGAVMKKVDRKRQYQEEKARKALGGGKGESAEANAAAEAAKKAESVEIKQEGGDKEKSRAKAKGKPEGPPSALALLSMMSTPSATKLEDRKSPEEGKKRKGVLYRPTVRAVQEKRLLSSTSAPTPAALPALPKPGAKKEEAPKAFRLMDLPKEVRTRIWKLAVVHHPVCIWPAMPNGKEQPDLAMAGREVRYEVLPIYYANNVFGIDITPLPKSEPAPKASKVESEGDKGAWQKASDGKCEAAGKAGERAIPEELTDRKLASAMAKQIGNKISKPETSPKLPKPSTTKPIPDPIAKIKPWLKALESGSHLSLIQHCVFDYAPQIIVPPKRFSKADQEKSFLVYLNIWRESDAAASEMPQVVGATAKTMIWRAKVEVHTLACCVLPRNAQYQRCVVKMTPEWLNGMVSVVLRTANRKGEITAEVVTRFAEILPQRSEDLLKAKCAMMG